MISDIKIVLFPAGDNLSFKQKEFILKKFNNISLTEIEECIKNSMTETEISEHCKEIESKEKCKDLFDSAKTICEIKDINIAQLDRLAILAEALDIEESDTGFDFALSDKDQRNDYIFQLLLIRYAIMSTVVEIMPLNCVVSCFASSSLQTMLATKIAKLYDFELDVKHFMKIASGTTGMSLLFKGIGSGISKLLPFKLIWRTSSAFASSYAIGIAAKAYIGAEGNINADNLKGIWESALEEGKDVFKQFKSYIFRNRKNLMNDLKKSLANSETKEL
ncbi:MAG: hypothetical protein II258_07990 [Spirochaetales bacterium]|nr:hypothetical protein [Spirochaetales bacterium]